MQLANLFLKYKVGGGEKPLRICKAKLPKYNVLEYSTL